MIGSVIGLAAVINPANALTAQEMQAQMYEIKQNETTKTIKVGGDVIPHKVVTLTAQIPGRVLSVSGVAGSTYKAGSVLLELTEDALRAKLNEAVSKRDAAQAQIQSAHVQYRSQVNGDNENMMMKNTPMSWMSGVMPKEKGSGFQADVSNAQSGVDQANAAYRMANSQIAAINSKFRDAKSLAPFDGVILKKYVEEGDTIQPGMKMLDFADIGILEIQVEVPAQQIEGLNEDMIIDVMIVDKKIKTQARVAKIFPMASARHTYTVKLELPDDKDSLIAPGMYAEVYLSDITKTAQSSPAIPASAILKGRSLPQVYVVKDNIPRLRAIRTEKEPLGNGQILVTRGLKIGEKILKNADQRFVKEWVETVKAQKEAQNDD
jgi:multidrug efflux pump subunit AcrA (membrane-fusion protein)